MASQREHPVALFDSGVGGLTVLHECLVSLPEEDFLYLGDDAFFPYGTKSATEITGRVKACLGYLLDQRAKLLVIACNSATATSLDTARALASEYDVELVAVIEVSLPA